MNKDEQNNIQSNDEGQPILKVSVEGDVATLKPEATPADKPQQEAPKSKKKDAKKKDDDAPSLGDVLRGQATEEDAPLTKGVTMHKILGGDFFDSTAIRSQLWVFVLITVFIIIYISNRYTCQKSYIQIDRLNKELQDAKYKALSTNSRLTEQTRESRVLESLAGNKDSVLHISTQPPYIVTIPQDQSNE